MLNGAKASSVLSAPNSQIWAGFLVIGSPIAARRMSELNL